LEGKIGRKKSENILEMIFLDCNNFSPHHPLRLNVPVPKGGGKQLKKVIPFFQTHPLHHPQVIFHSPLTFPTRQDFLEIKKYVHKI
jgi:hypothetical protein